MSDSESERPLRHCPTRIGGEMCVLPPGHKAHCIVRPVATAYRILMAKEVKRATESLAKLRAERERAT